MALISYAAGSMGEREKVYSIRIPFVLSPGQTFNLEKESRFELWGRECVVHREVSQYVLCSIGFNSEESARTYLRKACVGLIWCGLNECIGFKFDFDVVPIEFWREPIPVKKNPDFAAIASDKGWLETDGHFEAKQTVVIPEHKRLIIFGLGSVSSTVGRRVSCLSGINNAGFNDFNPEAVLNDPKLRLACEVYFSSHFESTPRASFLSRITVLEILSEDIESSDRILGLVDGFIEKARDSQASVNDESLNGEFESLLSRLNYLRQRSIKSGIRHLVKEQLQIGDRNCDAEEISIKISKLYDLRSKMLHDGKDALEEIQEGNNLLNNVVPRVLRALFIERAIRDCS